MRVYLGADHRGFELKEKIKAWLDEWKYEYEDLGAKTYDLKDDYTTYSKAVASKISLEEDAKGILTCGSGIGVDIVANKFKGVRSGLGKSVDQVRMGRNDDDMNVLVLAADFTTSAEAKDMIRTFLETRFEAAERFNRRLDQIKEIESKNS